MMSDVGMHGLLVSQLCTVLYHLLVGLHCGAVADFFITAHIPKPFIIIFIIELV